MRQKQSCGARAQAPVLLCGGDVARTGAVEVKGKTTTVASLSPSVVLAFQHYVFKVAENHDDDLTASGQVFNLLNGSHKPHSTSQLG